MTIDLDIPVDLDTDLYELDGLLLGGDLVDLNAVTGAIATTLGGLGLRIYDHGPDAPQPPCVYLYPEGMKYDTTYDGGADVTIVLQLLAASVETKGGQRQLNTFLSTNLTGSVADALRDNPTLSGAVNSTRVLPMRNYGTRQASAGLVRYWTAEIPVEIYA